MKKKISALFVIVIMMLSLLPQTALAATTHTVLDGEILNIETGELTHADSTKEILPIENGDTISVDADAAATVTGSKNVMIDCGAGAALTLENVTIDVSGTNGRLPPSGRAKARDFVRAALCMGQGDASQVLYKRQCGQRKPSP